MAPMVRPDIAALLAATEHDMDRCNSGSKCGRCNVLVTRSDLRKHPLQMVNQHLCREWRRHLEWWCGRPVPAEKRQISPV